MTEKQSVGGRRFKNGNKMLVIGKYGRMSKAMQGKTRRGDQQADEAGQGRPAFAAVAAASAQRARKSGLGNCTDEAGCEWRD